MINYNNEDYPTRTFRLVSDDTGQITVTVATQTLHDQLFDEDEEPVDFEADAVDNQIYFYLPDEVFNNDAADIAQSHLDQPFQLVEEL